MAQKKEVKMKDLKPNKDAKGGVARQTNKSGAQANRGNVQVNKAGGSANSATRSLS